MGFTDDCRRARELWAFWSSKRLHQPFVLWLDDVIGIAEGQSRKDGKKKVKLGKPDPFWDNFAERLSAAWDELEK